MPRKNKDFEVNERRARVSELYLQGLSQSKIGKEVGVTQQQVSNDLKVLVKQWQENNFEHINAVKAKELDKLNLIEKEAWQAFYNSVGEKRKAITKNGTNSRGSFEETSEQLEDLTGDPRYMQIILSCIERRCKILGIDAAIKTEEQGEKKVLISFKDV